MTISDLEHFKKLLLEREHNVREWLGSPETPNEEDITKAQALLGEIKGSLGRVEKQSFGSCEVCKGDIELYRLEIQPVTEVCLACITAEERAQLEEELFLASKIHRALLPQSIERIDGCEVSVRSLAASIVGGDYFDFLPSNGSGATRVVIADTMGKGLPAGLLMSNVQGALRILAEDIISPCQLISRLNQWLCRNVPVIKFISLACVLLDTDRTNGHRLAYTNAGHCPGLLIHGDNSFEWLEPTGGVLGVHEGFAYEEKAVKFSPGDLLVLYTDGVTEAENGRGDMFGTDRLARFMQDHRSEPLELLIENLSAEVRLFSDRPEFADDFTVIAIRKV
jgi:sigma-B regulation protein RsbU (phosphoserine phosphatase)